MNHNYYCLHTSAKRLPRPQFIFEEPCNKPLMATRLFHSLRELNPTGVGEYIYIYKVIHRQICFVLIRTYQCGQTYQLPVAVFVWLYNTHTHTHTHTHTYIYIIYIIYIYIYIYICCIAIQNTYACRIRTTNNKDERHSSQKNIPLTLLKGLCVRGSRELTELQHIDPHSIGHNRVSFPFSWAAQPGAWGPSLSVCWFSLPHLISNLSDLQTHLIST